ncbi:MAG: hypothetical protein QOJ39_1069 [Candidatus Eremiobacteraeota bacterium]|jgi:hypothetical protein|nr:hypothetical protein [Candidatus Eremiobacteraeota bacterium]
MRHWIPPLPLAAGIVFQAVAWILALAYAASPSSGIALAWVHAVALGWLTLVALSVLLHVVPAFTDLPWRGERIARAAVAAVLVGASALVVSFALNATAALAAAAVLLVAAVLAYVSVALITLAQPAPDRTSAAIARALSVTLLMLAATALLGGALAGAMAAAGTGSLAAGAARAFAVAPSHALLGIGAWLTVLITGVSAQTFRPMLGARSRSTRIHVLSGGALVLGCVLGAAGAPFSPALLRAGVTLAALGAFAYAADALDIARRATAPHPPVRAFVVASVTWLVVAAACATAAAWGAPLAATAVVAALAGWVGQMVNAHMHHLGVRVLTTLIRGDEDETRPWEVLDARLTWTTFALAQLAVLGITAGIAFEQPPAIAAGALAGLAAIPAMLANALGARHALRGRTVSLL